MTRMCVTILGVNIDAVTQQEALQQINSFLNSTQAHIVVTPNPEILLYAGSHEEYRTILNEADLSLPDGFGLRTVSRLRHTVTGVWIADQLLELAQSRRERVACILREDGRSSADQLQRVLQNRFANDSLQIFTISKKEWRQSDTKAIQQFQPSIVFVGLGFPEQELWLHEYVPSLTSVRIAIGVGGTFDYWTGSSKRAPRFLQNAGLEWLWRLCIQPTRVLRIFQAVVVFPIVVICKKIQKMVWK